MRMQSGEARARGFLATNAGSLRQLPKLAM